MAAIKNIGIITSGGDCGGLNAVVSGAARMATALGMKAFIIPNGYAGLYNLVDMASLVIRTSTSGSCKA
jgi:6-phosphofructokinase